MQLPWLPTTHHSRGPRHLHPSIRRRPHGLRRNLGPQRREELGNAETPRGFRKLRAVAGRLGPSGGVSVLCSPKTSALSPHPRLYPLLRLPTGRTQSFRHEEPLTALLTRATAPDRRAPPRGCRGFRWRGVRPRSGPREPRPPQSFLRPPRWHRWP
jgi:hypothetical protein